MFTTTSTELVIAEKSIHQKKGELDLAYEIILFEIKKTERWYQGKDGREVDLSIDSYVYSNGKFKQKISTITTSGHDFISDQFSSKVYITEYGCCDGPTMVHTFDMVTGKKIESNPQK